MRQKSHEMKNEEIWILGHKMTMHNPSGNYDMVIGETAPGVPGPPPHLHNNCSELFMVLEGSMEFLVNGEKKILSPGESVDLPAGTLHTFGNAGDVPCRYVNIHSPKGFSRFFVERGVNATEENAIEKSVSPEKIQAVIETAADYDMIIPQ